MGGLVFSGRVAQVGSLLPAGRRLGDYRCLGTSVGFCPRK